MDKILLADKVFLSPHWDPQRTASYLMKLAEINGYIFNPLQIRQMGQAERSIFKILIENHVYRIVWHNKTLISIWVSEYGFDDEIKHWPQDDTI
jgi:hypothetical protein